VDDDDDVASQYPLQSDDSPVQYPGGYTEAVHMQASHVAAGISKLKVTTEASSVRRTSNELKKVVDGMPDDPSDMIRLLLTAVMGFFAGAASQAFESIVAKDTLLRVKEREIRDLKEENRQFRDTNASLKKSTEDLEALWQEATQAVHKDLEEVAGLKDQLERSEAGRKENLGRILSLQGTASIAQSAVSSPCSRVFI
jgi:hypothetical protein